MKSIIKVLKNFNVYPHEILLRLKQKNLKQVNLKKHNTKLIPISYTYENFIYSGKYFIFVENLTPEKFHYITQIKKPLAIFTNKKLKPFLSNIPVFFSSKKLKGEKLTIEIKEKTSIKKTKVLYFIYGYGHRFINIFIPANEKRNIKVFEEIFKSLRTINYPRGYRVRFIFIENSEKFLIEKIYKDMFKDADFNILIDETGFGFEKILYKLNGYIFLEDKFINILDKYLSLSYIAENHFENLNIPNLIWMKSIEKNNYVNNYEEVSKNIFASIIFLAKEII